MRYTKKATPTAVFLLIALTTCLCMGCKAAEPQATPTQPTAAADSPTPGGTPLLEFDCGEDSARLVADMAAGSIPTTCDVLYDQMGTRPNVTVTDPATITHIYELVSDIVVTGESNMSITDSYHHVRFTLQDGSTVGYSFEGEGLLSCDRTNYDVVGTAPLWDYVRELQEEVM